MTQQVLYEEHNRHIALLTLNRPEKHNAFNADIIQSLNQYLIAINDNPAIRAVILKANGKHFSAGADLAWMQQAVNFTLEENISDAMELAELMKNLYQLNKPCIVCAQGASFGGALGLVACADIAFASENAKFCLSEVKLGLIPAVISPYVIAAIGERQARRYFVSAEVFDAKKALAINLIHDIVTTEEMEQTSLTLAEQIAANGPLAVRQAKALVQRTTHRVIDEDLMRENAIRIAKIRTGEEGQEGLQAFFDKRPAKWTEGIKND